jgi:hypothetical protein
MTDTAFQGDSFQADAFQIVSGSGGIAVESGGLSDGYTYIPGSKSVRKIRKLLEAKGAPLADEFEAKPAEIAWPEGYRVRQKYVLPPKEDPGTKWWDDVAPQPALAKIDKFEWWDKTADPSWNARALAKFEWWDTE